jgi:hypothetical protein
MIARCAEWQGRERASVATDATYGNGHFLQWLTERGSHNMALNKNLENYAYYAAF